MSLLPLMVIAEWWLPLLISNHKPFVTFYLLCPAEEGRDAAALVPGSTHHKAQAGHPRASEGAPALLVPAMWLLWPVALNGVGSCPGAAVAVAVRHHPLHLPWDLYLVFSISDSYLGKFGNIWYCWCRYLSAICFAKLNSSETPSTSLWVSVKSGPFYPISPLTICKMPPPLTVSSL